MLVLCSTWGWIIYHWDDVLSNSPQQGHPWPCSKSGGGSKSKRASSAHCPLPSPAGRLQSGIWFFLDFRRWFPRSSALWSHMAICSDFFRVASQECKEILHFKSGMIEIYSFIQWNPPLWVRSFMSFDKCVQSCNHHQNPDTTELQITHLCPLWSTPFHSSSQSHSWSILSW